MLQNSTSKEQKYTVHITISLNNRNFYLYLLWVFQITNVIEARGQLQWRHKLTPVYGFQCNCIIKNENCPNCYLPRMKRKLNNGLTCSGVDLHVSILIHKIE